MWRNRFLYLLALAGVVVFFLFYYAWFSEYLLWLTVGLPLFSLLVSLPAMLTMGPRVDAPALVPRGSSASITIEPGSPLPPTRCRFRLRTAGRLSGDVRTVPMGRRDARLTFALPTEHCGLLECRPRRVWVSDYLGLFSLPRFWRKTIRITVVPIPKPPRQMPGITQLLCPASRPKAGGGYSETYELRDYRPGDSLRQIHWKLTAKKDDPIVREPQEPSHGPVILSLDIRGTADEIDRTLEKTLFISRWLIEQDLQHKVQWISGDELQSLTMTAADQLPFLARSLAESRPTAEGLTAAGSTRDASWHFHVLPDC